MAIDSLSRDFEDQFSCQAISLLQPAWLKELTQSWEEEPHVIVKLLLSPDCVLGFLAGLTPSGTKVVYM